MLNDNSKFFQEKNGHSQTKLRLGVMEKELRRLQKEAGPTASEVDTAA